MKYLFAIVFIFSAFYYFSREDKPVVEAQPQISEDTIKESKPIELSTSSNQPEIKITNDKKEDPDPSIKRSEQEERVIIADVVFDENHPKFKETIFANTYENYKRAEQEKSLETKNDPSYRFAKFDRKLDIIWVIDDSGSMEKHHEKISAQIKEFLTFFLEKDVDFKMGIVSTSLETISNGEGLTRDDYRRNPAPFISNFQTYLNFGSAGSGDEKGLLAIQSFLESNGNFFIRPNSQVIAIVLSDENDSSFDPTKSEDQLLNTNTFMAALKSTYFQNNEFKVYSIIEFPPSALAGTRYAHASYLTKGIVGNIKEDFHKILLDIGGHVLGLKD